MRLAIFTHVLHQTIAREYSAYAPYIREMNLWLQQVDEVEVVAPSPLPAPQPPKGELINKDAYQHPQLIFTKIPSFDVLKLKSTYQAIPKIPIIIFKMAGAMKRADHLHVRCPGNIGLLAAICQIFFPKKPKTAKYAGNWDPGAKQPWTYNLQKWILSNTFLTRNMKVLVYGDWPDQSNNILPFFTASFSESEIEKIEKKISAPYKFLFVGNLVSGKQPLFALKLVKTLREKNIEAELHVYGDGEMMDAMKQQAENKAYIHLHGNQNLEVLKQAYKEAHFLILASQSEGWPKAIAEAMFFGCIPIASAVSCLHWMLGGGSRGFLIPGINQGIEKRGKAGDKIVDRGQRSLPEPIGAGVDSKDGLNETVDRIIELMKNPEKMRRMSMDAQKWSQEYTLEKFEAEIKKLLATPQSPKGEQKR